MYYTRFMREDGAGTGGGGLQSLMDNILLDNPPVDPPPSDPPKDPPGETPEAKAARELASAQEAIKKEAFLEDGITLKPGYLKDATTGAVSKDPNYTEPVEGADENGEPLPGYKKDADGKIVVDPDYKAPELTAAEEGKQFFDAVKVITGDEDLEIEFPENMDPLSPEGLAYYTKVIREDASQMFEQFLQVSDPRSYAYMVHRKNGGTDEDFFNEKGFVLPNKEEFDASADMQTAVYKHDLKVKGLDDEAIDALVQKAIKDNKLKDKADAAYTTIDKAQKKQLDDITKLDAERTEANNTAINGMIARVDKAIGAELRFVIPESDKKPFREFVIANMRYAPADNGTGTFSIVQKIDEPSLNSLMESLFFQYKKGDLKAIISKQVKTEAAQNIRLRMKTNQAAPGGGSGGPKPNENYITLGELVKPNQQ